MGKFTAEEIQIAKAVDLVDLAEQIYLWRQDLDKLGFGGADRDSIEKERQVLSGSGYGLCDDLQPVFLVPV